MHSSKRDMNNYSTSIHPLPTAPSHTASAAPSCTLPAVTEYRASLKNSMVRHK